MQETASAIRKFRLNTATYVPIVAPIECNYYLLIGSSDGSAMKRCSDPDNEAESMYTIPANGWYAMVAPTPSINRAFYRFQKGQTVTYLKATVGTPDVFVEFVA